MKRSRHVSISLVATRAGAALAAGCGSAPAQPGWQTCVDRTTNVSVDRKSCDDEAARTTPGNAGYYPGYYPHYGWYYYPRGFYTSAPLFGTPVPPGGSLSSTPVSSVAMAHGPGAGGFAGSISRGGFGSTAAGHAGSGA